MDKNPKEQPRVVRVGKKTSGKKIKYRAKNPTTSRIKRVIFTILKIGLTLSLVFVITACIVGTALTIYVMEFIDSESTIDLNNIELNYTSIIYGVDKDGNNAEIQRLHKGENRIWVGLDKIPQDMIDAIVCAEDETFFRHKGINFKRTLGAFLNEFNFIDLGGRQGGSTITQQLIKNINGDTFNRTIDVKIQEIFQAMNLERHFSKPQIIEAYLNYIPLHFNTNGVQAGAKKYFNKDVSKLTLNEAVALACTTKSPKNYNPIQNPDENATRRKYVLKKMLELKDMNGQPYITKEEYDKALNEKLVLAVPTQTDKDKPAVNKNDPQNYYITALVKEVSKDLAKEYNYSQDFAEQQLYIAGYRVYSNMDIEMQRTLGKMFSDNATFGKKNAKVPQASMVIEDLKGNVRALVGGRGDSDPLGFNRATQAKRPAGSTIKPLAVYAPAFENDLIDWGMIVDDNPIEIIENGKKRPYPKNYNNVYEGNMTIIDAIKHSKNTIAVKLVKQMSPQISFDFLTKKLGFTSPRASGATNDVTLASMALGDGGSTLLEITSAYQIFGNGGYYTPPKLYSKVVDANGKVILDVTNRQTSQVISPQTAFIMNKALWNVVNGGGSGGAARSDKIEVVGKTGTSNSNKDYLFMGVTPYYVAGIRYGNDDDTVVENKGYGHIEVWGKVMNAVQKKLPAKKHTLNASGVSEHSYCLVTGLLATSNCPKQATGYYKDSNTPHSCAGETTPEIEPPIESMTPTTPIG